MMNALEKILEETSNIYRVVESNEDLEWNRAVNKCQNIIHGCMEDIPDIAKQANDILEKLSFFYGQRAGRELWNDKPRKVQDEDIASFNRDIDFLRTIINDLNSKRCGWIPVEERLPEARQHDNGEPIEFIAMIKGAGVPTVLSINEQDEWFSYDEMFYGEGRYNNYDVVAWKPLPEPYIKNPK